MKQQLNLDEAQKYCVFESNENVFGFAAMNVRSVIPRPQITALPFSDPVMVGVSHVQNEFLPVISLRSLLEVQYENNEAEQQLMIMSTDQSGWGMLIDRAICLTSLEVSISAFADRDDTWSKVVMGSASHENQVLQILNSEAVYQYATRLMDGYWMDSNRFNFQTGLC